MHPDKVFGPNWLSNEPDILNLQCKVNKGIFLKNTSKRNFIHISKSLQQCGILNSVIYVQTLKKMVISLKHATRARELPQWDFRELCKDMYEGNKNRLSNIWNIYLDYTYTKSFNFLSSQNITISQKSFVEWQS